MPIVGGEAQVYILPLSVIVFEALCPLKIQKHFDLSHFKRILLK